MEIKEQLERIQQETKAAAEKAAAEATKAAELKAAEMVKATAEMFCNWNVEEDGILGGGTVGYHRGPEEIHVPIIYGDYFMVEALLRMQEKDVFLW